MPVLSVHRTVIVAEVLDGVEALDDHLRCRHPPWPRRQADRHDRGQELRGEADRQGQREQHRVDERSGEREVDGEDGRHQHDHGAHEQEPELGHAALEARRDGHGPSVGDAPNSVVAPVRPRLPSRAADHVGADEDRIRRWPIGAPGRNRARALLDGEDSPVSAALVDEQRSGLHDAAVAGDDVTGVEQRPRRRGRRPPRDLDHAAVAEHLDLDLDHRQEVGDRPGRAALLPEPEQAAQRR